MTRTTAAFAAPAGHDAVVRHCRRCRSLWTVSIVRDEPEPSTVCAACGAVTPV